MSYIESRGYTDPPPLRPTITLREFQPTLQYSFTFIDKLEER